MDLDPTVGGSIRYQTIGVAPERRLIVQFTNIQHYNNGSRGLEVTFQFKLFEGSNAIEVHYLFAVAAPGYTHSAGIENQDGSNGIQYFLGAGPLGTPIAVRYLPVALCETPGPDAGNYYCSGVAYDFANIAGTGTHVVLADDAVSAAVPIGFPFGFYGTDYTELYISSNGFLSFLPDQGFFPNLPQFPAPDVPNGLIAALAGDLDPSFGGAVQYKTIGAAPDRIMIVQFTSVPWCCSQVNPPTATFQIKLFERSNSIEVHYAASNSPAFNYTGAGVENQAGSAGVAFYQWGAKSFANPAAVRYTPGAARPAYVRSVVGPPWGASSNEGAMNMVFGAGNWDDLRYETTSMPDILKPNRGFIYMEGSDENADELEAFLTANQVPLEAWVSAGKCLFINAAPSEGDGMSYGFGGVALAFVDTSEQGNAADPLHPIFNGPFTPIVPNYTGVLFGHATVSGGGVSSLINGESQRSTLAERSWGAGFTAFGGMTVDAFHAPQPEAHNLRANIIHYLSHHGCGISPPYCGNGLREGNEACDDGNNTSGDCCSASCRIEDADGDGVCDSVDCAPSDPTAFAIPLEVTAVKFQADKSTLVWNSLAAVAGSGTTYDVIADALAALPVGPAEPLGACGAVGASVSTSGVPANYWFLVRGRNACALGPWGRARFNALPPFPLLQQRTTVSCP